MTEKEIRKELCRIGCLLVQKNLVAGPGGNISVRQNSWVYLSPSGFALDEIQPEEWVKVNIKTGKQEGKKRPTCEISMHLGIYLAREDIKAVVHTHPAITTGLVSAGVKLRPIFPDFVALLGPVIPIVDYVIPAGQTIRKAVVRVIRKANVVALKNHGAVCVGQNIYEAFTRAWLLEESARMLMASLIAGKVRYLTRKEIEGIENLEAENYRKTLLKNR